MSSPSLNSAAQEILIAEDSATQALLLQSILERHNFVVTVARNGRRALEVLEKRRPVLIISDIQMPEMDGYTLCRGVKAKPEWRDIPVMLLTSLSAPQDIIHGLECGADNFVVKPYEEEFLLSRIRSVLASRALRTREGEAEGIAVEFAGERYVIEAGRRQILNLLLSTYETAVKTNRDLVQAHEELKAAQAQLIEAEKLQSVGRLAAGVAHEVRNPLAILEMGLGFLADLEVADDGKMILGEMREAVRRASSVINSLMDMAAPRELGMQEGDLHEVINRALLVLEGELSQGQVEVLRDFTDELPRSRFDARKMEQVFVNLFTNALHAMPSGGQLSIRTRFKTLGSENLAFNAGDRSGVRYREGDRVILVEIRDTGSGIVPENLTKMFEPFFSTKPTGQGMGLGLTVARKIIEMHHGTILIQNHPERGAMVTLMFKTT